MPYPGESANHISRIFGGLNRRSFLESLGSVEAEADILSERRDPLHFNIAPLSRDDRYRLQNKLRDVTRLDEITAGLNLSEYQADEADRPFAAIDEPAGEMTSYEELFFRAQSFRVDDAAAIEQGESRYSLANRQLRPEVIKRHQQLINQGVPEGASRMVFDVETTGTGPNAQVWQLAGRYTDEAGEAREFDFRFSASQMDLGDFSDLQGRTDTGTTQLSPQAGFEEYIQTTRGDGVPFRSGEEAARGLRQFLDIAESSDQWVGHNVAFDIDMVTRQMEDVFQQFGTEEDVSRVRQFADQATQRAVDTHLLAAHHLGGIGADEAADYRRLGMDNILLRTSLLEDIENTLGQDYTDRYVTNDVLQRAQGHGGRAAVLGRLETGTHFGDIDVWFEEQLMDQFQRQGRGENVLRNLTQEEALGQGDVSPLRSTYRDLIGAPTAGAVTPTTKMFREGENLYTPIQQQVINMRQVSGNLPTDVNREHILRAASYGDWVNQAATSNKPFGQLAQDLPQDTGLPFEGLSPHERTISGLLGQHTANVSSDELRQTRQLVGEGLGQGIFQMRSNAQGPRVYGRGRVAALPTELIQQAEQQGVLSTQYTAAATGQADQTQFARLSTIDYERDGRRIHDLALVGDISDDDASRLGEYIRNLDPETQERFGFGTQRQTEHIASTVENYGSRFGLQLGILGEGDAQTNERLVQHMRKIGADVDTGAHKMRVPITSTPTSESGKWTTGPAMMDVPGHEVPEENISRNLQVLDRVRDQATQQLQDRRMRNAANVARTGDAGMVNRFLKAVDSIGSISRRNLLVGGAAVLGGGLLLNRQQNAEQREIYNAPFQEMPTEPRSKGRQPNYRIPRKKAAPRYLAQQDTTDLPTALYRERTGHHRMGPRNRTQTGR